MMPTSPHTTNAPAQYQNQNQPQPQPQNSSPESSPPISPDYSYDDGGGDPEYGTPPSIFSTPNHNDMFLSEQLVRNTMLFGTDIKPFTQDFLNDQGISVGCRTYWKKFIVSLFDMSKILSMLEQRTFSFEESILWAKLLVNMGKVHYETFDFHNPLTLTMQEETLYNYRHFLTRAVGGKEREYQSRIAFSQDTTQTQVIKDMRGPPRKGRLFGLLG